MRASLSIRALSSVGTTVSAVILLSLGYASLGSSGVQREKALLATPSLPGSTPVSISHVRALQPHEIGESGQTGRESTVPHIPIVPDQMTFAGDVTTRANCTHPTVCSWLDGAPPGSIMVGVDPKSPYPVDWNGGSATATVYIGNIVSPTVAVLTVSWPDRDGKGIHSPNSGVTATIDVDGYPLWAKRALHQSTFGDYYAVQQPPVAVTFVVAQSVTHTLTFRVPAHTAWDISEIRIELCPMPSLLRGYCYSPFRYCQSPQQGHLPYCRRD